MASLIIDAAQPAKAKLHHSHGSCLLHRHYSRVHRNRQQFTPLSNFLGRSIPSETIVTFNLVSRNHNLKGRIILANCQGGGHSISNSNDEKSEKEGNARNGASSSGSKLSTEKHGRRHSRWWYSVIPNWKWEPLIRAEEITSFLFQVVVALSLMRLLRIDIPFPGLEPRQPVTVITLPYSDFLSKIDSNQVKKAEIDRFNITFKLKNKMKSDAWSMVGINRNFQELESLLRGIPSMKRKIVYRTTRPEDIKTPYEKMIQNGVQFRSPEKRSGGIFAALAALFHLVVLADYLYQLPHTAAKIKKFYNGNSGGTMITGKGGIITFDDVAGIDDAKEELEEIVEFLRNPEKYMRVGARPPRGVLLVGLPGTGKTLLAKAVAGEAQVPFISCSASEFVELFIGVGASRVRDLFARAKNVAPSIIFIDEIDAVARRRNGKFNAGGNDERDQTLNQLLIEMDGFDSNSAVIVLGATNRSDVLDPALQRPGRFDRVIRVETPDRNGREAILKVHVSKNDLPIGPDVDLNKIACMTTGFTGADLANLVNESALLAGRRNKLVVEKIDFIEAVERSIAGIEKKTTRLQGSEKAVVAHHEAGHAIVGAAVATLLPGQPRVEKLSILPRSGGSLGFTYVPPVNEDRYLMFIDELRGRLATLFGGRAAEEIVYSGRVSTGALDDIQRATDLAYKAVAEYGLSHTVGPLSLATLLSGGTDAYESAAWGRDQGHLVDLVQKEVKLLLHSALDAALSVLRTNSTVLDGLGTHLEEREKLEGEELQKWLKLVVAPKELADFVRGEHQCVLPQSCAQPE